MSENQCVAFTASGNQCMNTAQEGSEYCHIHAHLAPVEDEPVIEAEVQEEPVVVEATVDTTPDGLDQPVGSVDTMYTVKNIGKTWRNLHLPGPESKLDDSRYVAPNEKLELTEAQFNSSHVQGMLNLGILRLVKPKK